MIILALIVGGYISVKQRHDPGHVWGKYYESYYAMKYAERNGDMGSAKSLLETNWKWFDRLIESNLIRQISIDEYRKEPGLYKVIDRVSYSSGGLVPGDGKTLYVDCLKE